MAKPRNMLLANSLGDDKTSSHEQALLAIYKRLRPGNPLALQKAQELFHEKFFDPSRYRIGRVGRFRMNRKFNTDVSLDETALRGEDVVACVNYLYSLWSGDPNCYPDDIDHLGNRRIRTIDELICEDLRNKGFLKLRRNILDRFHQGDSPRALINQKNISTAIEYFFGRNELSQVVDQTNPLSMLTHERRLSALGPGGLNRKRAGFEVRDVHATHYGRICPIETPEGQNIGLISYLSIFAQIDDFGFLTSPYRRVENGVLSEEIEWLRADDEIDKIFAPADTPRTESTADQPYGALIPDPNTDLILARKDGEYVQVRLEEVNYIDVAPNQMIGVSAGLIPFLEHDDANRALMGSNMQRQAVPLLQSEAPIVGTGMEVPAALNSSLLLRAHRAGTVTYMDSMKIVIDDVDVYHLRKFAGLNGSSCENQRPIVEIGEHVEEGQVIADGACTDQGVLALGRNVLVGFMVWDGYNYEDAIILSEELVQKDVYTSIHIKEYDTEIRDTKTGRESFTRDVPNASEKALSKLDENGIIRVGTYVSRNDILVGKVVPKQKVELSPEEKLLQAIFGKSSEEVKNESLVVPAGVEGVVIGAYHFRSLASLSEEERTTFNGELARIENEGNAKIREEFASMISDMELLIGDQFEMKDDKGDPLVQSRDDRYIAEQAKNYSFAGMCSSNNIEKGTELYDSLREIYVSRRAAFEDAIDDRDRKYNKAREGDQLKRGVLQMVKVYIATKRAISVGDKMAGRHGNKGVIARILPREDMPFLADGTPLQILLNPLGVPSRMNVGQILRRTSVGRPLHWGIERSRQSSTARRKRTSTKSLSAPVSRAMVKCSCTTVALASPLLRKRRWATSTCLSSITVSTTKSTREAPVPIRSLRSSRLAVKRVLAASDMARWRCGPWRPMEPPTRCRNFSRSRATTSTDELRSTSASLAEPTPLKLERQRASTSLSTRSRGLRLTWISSLRTSTILKSSPLPDAKDHTHRGAGAVRLRRFSVLNVAPVVSHSA